jgi:DNA invertase Pin-like site-specific DNA recombinase
MSPVHHGKFISYLRVSTQQQGHAGLGIQAQRTAVRQYLDGGRWKLLKEFVEVESGKRNDRPELERALALCKATGARLVIAKLDRLSRNAAFLLKLRDSGTKFVAADMPDATELTVGILAVVAEDEARRISQRTKAALAEAKKRGTKLGNPNGARPLRAAGKGNVAALAAKKANSIRYAQNLAPIIAEIEAGGVTTLRGIAEALAEKEIYTPGGRRQWAETQVARVRRLIKADSPPGLL